MNIAVLFTGNIRSFDQCKENFKKELDFLNPDYFVTTYDTRYNFRSYVNFHNDHVLEEDYIKSLFSDMNPKAIKIDNLAKMIEFFNSEREKFDPEMRGCDANHFLQFYKLKQGLEMISEYEKILGKKYDIIIRSRLDLTIRDINTLDLSNLNDSIINGYELYSKWVNSPHSDDIKVWNDFFMISTPENMNKVLDNLLEEFYKKTFPKSSYAFPHGVFEAGIIKSKLNVINKDILYRIIRYNDVTELVT